MIRPATMPAGQTFGQPGAPMSMPPGTFPGFPGYPPPMPPPRRRGISTTALSVAIVIMLAVATMLVTAIVAGKGATATMAEPEISMPPSPGPDDGPEVRQEWLMQTATAALDANAAALLDGDQEGWLALFDDSIHEDMQHRFDSLQALAVSSYEYQVLSDHPIDKGDNEFQLRLAANYCLGGKEDEKCAATSIFFDTNWSDIDGQVHITRVEESYELGPRPWEVEDLKAKVGDRAIVAGPAKYADQLDDALNVAEEAAENADQYADYGPVDRYVIYLAGDEEFQRWYGLNDPMTNVVGFAIPLTLADKDGKSVPGGSDVVVHADRVRDQVEFESTMRHELGHVATLHHAPEHQEQKEEWWMAEGLAELIDHDPKNSVDNYLRKYDVAEYIDEKKWDGKIEPATNDDDLLAGSAKYGIAFYSTYYLFDEYGKDKFMEIFDKVARNGEDVDEASQDVYGKSYNELEKEMTKFVEDTAE